MPDLSPLPTLGLSGYAMYALHKVVGPSLGRVGDVADRWVEYRTRNVGRIAEKAGRRIGEDIERPGGVAARVAVRIIEDGSLCDDELMQEYFGGVLAASRTPTGRDDRGARWAGTVARMSSYEVRLHYLIYRALRDAVAGRDDVDLTDGTVLQKMLTYLPWGEVREAFDWDATEPPFEEVAEHATVGLLREGLADAHTWACGGDVELVRTVYASAPDGGICLAPTFAGIELFAWAHGHRGLPVAALLDRTRVFDLATPLPPIQGAHVQVHGMPVRASGETDSC